MNSQKTSSTDGHKENREQQLLVPLSYLESAGPKDQKEDSKKETRRSGIYPSLRKELLSRRSMGD